MQTTRFLYFDTASELHKSQLFIAIHKISILNCFVQKKIAQFTSPHKIAFFAKHIVFRNFFLFFYSSFCSIIFFCFSLLHSDLIDQKNNRDKFLLSRSVHYFSFVFVYSRIFSRKSCALMKTHARLLESTRQIKAQLS